MEELMGLLRIRVRKGKNLVVRDTVSSDPYVAITMGDQTVYDKDTFTVDDKMGDAEIDIKPYIECLKMGDAEIDIKPYIECLNMGLQGLPIGTKVDRVQPNRQNCLADESCIIWNNGKMYQDMSLRLRNVESGEVEIQIELIDLPGRKSVWS